MSGASTVILPTGTDKAFALELKRLNPGLITIEVMAPDASLSTESKALAILPKTEVHVKEVGVWLDLLPGLLAAGATILCPPAWLPFVAGAVRIGVPKIRALIEGSPARERWPIAEILALDAEVQALPDPQT